MLEGDPRQTEIKYDDCDSDEDCNLDIDDLNENITEMDELV